RNRFGFRGWPDRRNYRADTGRCAYGKQLGIPRTFLCGSYPRFHFSRCDVLSSLGHETAKGRHSQERSHGALRENFEFIVKRGVRSRLHDQHTNPKSDITIAQEAHMRPIAKVARQKLGIELHDLHLYGHYKAKISMDYISKLANGPNGKLILVTAITPTAAGEGKTTTTVGLGDALNLLDKRAVICLREPSLGPCFGVKGGAAGGGYAQVLPMEDINLHFTGDFHAIAAANNLLGA